MIHLKSAEFVVAQQKRYAQYQQCEHRHRKTDHAIESIVYLEHWYDPIIKIDTLILDEACQLILAYTECVYHGNF